MIRSLYPVKLGRVFGTSGAHDAFIEAGENPLPYLARHAMGDWGIVDAEDAQANRSAVRDGGRLLSAYELSTGVKVWIITEADRSTTTILLPSEY